MLKREIITTLEGTKTLYIPDWDESYHSHHGVLQESLHVFIDNGLNLIDLPEISILEMGFGTGLNALLTLQKSIEKKLKINYFTLEKYPVTLEEVKKLNYGSILDWSEAEKYFHLIHETAWGHEMKINEFFHLTKFKNDFFDLKNLPIQNIDLVYYDVFGAKAQPELWEVEIFKQIYLKMNVNALLTTYSSKGSARRAMQEAGFEVEKKQGAKGKREMVNALKIKE
ncbi:MAG: tRNA (5-methylaminomethyl-2-thiouridine)(34)-methyltransferase MnmD [Flavobacteriaceae bacterium]|jgi:tRNA U34 5-methylaminomethyl-2-thiouridine-forming methyltransferase MnmC|nr:tRNA (5-methylaminomethyl-2-thiouridine)(34)-methyltransferase MnmD [Flavobacteriaceae bacterium]